jgi:NTE family protein
MTTYSDLERLARINRILGCVEPTLARELIGDLRPLHTVVVVPKEDIRAVAAPHARELPHGVRLLLKGLGAMNRMGMQLVSYLLFESGFTRELIDMGFRDALAMEDALRAFLFDEPMNTLYAPAHLKIALEH